MIITPATLITPEGYPQIYEKVKTLMLEIKEEYFGESPYLETMIISKFLEILTCVGRQRVNARSKQQAEGICGEVYPGYRLY